MFGVHGSGDTSGFGGLRLPGYAPAPAERPFGGWFDELADELGSCLDRRGIARDAIQQITIDRGEITFYVRRESILELCRTFRDDAGPAVRAVLVGLGGRLRPRGRAAAARRLPPARR